MRLTTVRELGLLVNAERQRQGLSMGEVAARAGCSRESIAALEGGGEHLEIALVLQTLSALRIRLDAQSTADGQDGAA